MNRKKRANHFTYMRNRFYQVINDNASIASVMNEYSVFIEKSIKDTVDIDDFSCDMLLFGGHSMGISSIYSDLDLMFIYPNDFSVYLKEVKAISDIVHITEVPRVMIHNYLYKVRRGCQHEFSESFQLVISGRMIRFRYWGYSLIYKVRDFFLSRSPHYLFAYISNFYLRYDHFLLEHREVLTSGYYKSIREKIISNYNTIPRTKKISSKVRALRSVLERCMVPDVNKLHFYKDYVTFLKIYKLALYAFYIVEFPSSVQQFRYIDVKKRLLNDRMTAEIIDWIEQLLSVRICLDIVLFDQGVKHSKIKLTSINDEHISSLVEKFPRFLGKVDRSVDGFKMFLYDSVTSFTSLLSKFAQSKLNEFYDV